MGNCVVSEEKRAILNKIEEKVNSEPVT